MYSSLSGAIEVVHHWTMVYGIRLMEIFFYAVGFWPVKILECTLLMNDESVKQLCDGQHVLTG